LRREGSGKKLEKIACLLGSFRPIGRGRCKQARLQFALSQARSFFVGLDVRRQPAQLGGLLRGHAAMLIQVDACLVETDTCSAEEMMRSSRIFPFAKS